MWWVPLLKSKWTWIALAMVALTTYGSIQVYNYGVKRYNEGVFAERAGWTKIVNQARTERDEARDELTRLREARNAEAEQARRERDRALSQVQQDIRNATNLEDQFAAYSAHRSELRSATARNLSSARADYLSSIGDAGGGSSGGIGSFDLDPNEFGGCHVRPGAGSLVGNCLG